METTLALGHDVQLVGKPQQMLDAAKSVADVLVKLVHERKLFKKFGDKEHLLVEAWQTVGHFYGVTGQIASVEDWTDEITGEQGFKAHAEAVHVASGKVISEAWAICLNNEDNWSTRPKYEYPNNVRTKVGDVLVPRFQLMSMAQTRALSKVLRNVFAFVVVLAGFDPTPAEEMTGTEGRTSANGSSNTPANGDKKPEGPKNISDPQRKRIYALGHAHNCPSPEIVKILNRNGFKAAFDVTVDKYEALCKEIETYKP